MAAFEAFVAGLTAGIAVAAPIGPMAVVCIEKTLAAGWSAGVAHGCGAATVHAGYALLATAGLGVGASEWLQSGQTLLPLLSGIVLLTFALRTMLRAKAAAGVPRAPDLLRGAYVGALLLGGLNPMTLVLFIGLTPLLLTGGDAGLGPFAIAGVAAGSTLWWIVLSGAVASLRRRMSPTLVSVCNSISGAVLAALGIFMLGRADIL